MTVSSGRAESALATAGYLELKIVVIPRAEMDSAFGFDGYSPVAVELQLSQPQPVGQIVESSALLPRRSLDVFPSPNQPAL
jgi:hypothetical protein